ncbi:glycosyltransferase 87 family protein [Nocardioides fonticola]|uniref:Glycosyltransferase 87 family protein n=1 Tax=Nocardioides fonticola TaxID=450363 RepID=A0ABP7Y2C3_9ACTN
MIARLRSDRALGALLLVTAGVAAVAAWRWNWFLDLQVYRMGGSALTDGRLYTARYPIADLPFTYPPFAALVMTPLAVLPWPLAAGLWAAVSALALAIVVEVVRERCAPAEGWLRRTPLWVLVAAMVPLQPVWSTFSFGQINLVLMALVVLDVLGPQRRWSGVLVGVAAGIKLTPLFLIAFLVVIGRRRPAVIAALSAAGTVLGATVLLPRQSWDYWTVVLFDPGRIGAPEYAGNQSLAGLLPRLLGHDAPSSLWLAVAAPIGVIALLMARRVWRQGDGGDGLAQVLGLCVAAIGMLLCSPISWDHHWVWLVPVLLGLLAGGERRRLVTAAVLIAVLASRAIWWAPFRDGREFAWTPWDQVSGNAYVWAGLVVLAVAAVQTSGRSSSSATQRAAESSRSSGSPPSSMRSQAS